MLSCLLLVVFWVFEFPHKKMHHRMNQGTFRTLQAIIAPAANLGFKLLRAYSQQRFWKDHGAAMARPGQARPITSNCPSLVIAPHL